MDFQIKMCVEFWSLLLQGCRILHKILMTALEVHMKLYSDSNAIPIAVWTSFSATLKTQSLQDVHPVG